MCEWVIYLVLYNDYVDTEQEHGVRWLNLKRQNGRTEFGNSNWHCWWRMDERHSPWWWYVFLLCTFIFLPTLSQGSFCSSLHPHGYVMCLYLSCCYYRSSTAPNTGCKDRWYWGLKYVSSFNNSVIFYGQFIFSAWFGKTVSIEHLLHRPPVWIYVALSKTTLKYWLSWT